MTRRQSDDRDCRHRQLVRPYVRCADIKNYTVPFLVSVEQQKKKNYCYWVDVDSAAGFAHLLASSLPGLSRKRKAHRQFSCRYKEYSFQLYTVSCCRSLAYFTAHLCNVLSYPCILYISVCLMFAYSLGYGEFSCQITVQSVACKVSSKNYVSSVMPRMHDIVSKVNWHRQVIRVVSNVVTCHVIIEKFSKSEKNWYIISVLIY